MNPATRRIAVLLILMCATLGLGFALAGNASAHATLVGSDPVDGSRHKSAPAVVTITFDERVGLAGVGYLHIVDQKGRRVDVGSAFHPDGDGSQIQEKLLSGLGDGAYIASYRVVSADSHPSTGTVRFVVGNGLLSAAVIPSSIENRTTSVAFGFVRWMSYAGFALVGGAWLPLSVWPQGRAHVRARSVIWTGWAATGLAAIGELLLQAPYAAGLGPSKVLSWPLLNDTLHTEYGTIHCLRLIVLGALAMSLGSALRGQRRPLRLDAVAWPLAAILAVTYAVTGHAATNTPHLLSVPLDTLHILAMATWFGGLVVLLTAVLPRGEPDELRAVLPTFSRVAFGSVVVLALTGTYQAWRGIGTRHAIFTTAYGQLVVVKVLLFVGLLALGNISRRVIARRFARTPVAWALSATALEEIGSEDGLVEPAGGGLSTRDVRRLRRSVLVEIVPAIGVLVATAALVAQPRGKEAIITRELRSSSGSADLGHGHRVSVTINPGKHGVIAADVVVSPGVTPSGITATATLPARELGPIPIALVASSADVYTASGISLPDAGRWVFNLVVTTSEFDATAAQVTVIVH